MSSNHTSIPDTVPASAKVMPKNVKMYLTIAGVFMPFFLILPFFFWGSEAKKLPVNHALIQAERLAPVGRIVVKGSAPVAEAQEVPFDPANVYQTVCSACHATGTLDAPKPDDKSAWEARISARGGIDKIIAQGITGLNAMPAKGGASVSDEQFGEVVRYILKQANIE